MADDDQDDTGTDDTGTDDTGTDDQGTGGDDGGQEDCPLLNSEGKPFGRADLDKLNEALRKARGEARAAKRGKTSEKQSETVDASKVAADAAAAADGKWKPRLVRTAARTAFLEAGLVLPKDNADGAMSRVVKLLDVDDLDVTDDGEVEGLREQVADIKADFPHLFATNGGRPGRVDGADKSGTNGKPKTASEKQAAMLLSGNW